MSLRLLSGARLRTLRVLLAVSLTAVISSSSFVSAQSAGADATVNSGMVVTRLWDDINRNGQQEHAEPGVADALVSLLDCAGNFVESRSTNALGIAPFVAAAGCYRLSYAPVHGYRYSHAEGAQNLANNSDADAATRMTGEFEVLAGRYLINVDAGIMKVHNAEIGDRVWHDLNGNGLQEFTEPGIADVQLNLLHCSGTAAVDLNGAPITTISDLNGQFLFADLNAGCYKVHALLRDDYLISQMHAGNSAMDSDIDPLSSLSMPIELQDSEGIHDLDIGLFNHGRIGDFVWLDDNRNGVQDPNEGGVAGVQVLLLNADGAPLGQMQTTDANGAYAFSHLVPGNYQLQFVVPEGYIVAAMNQGDSDELDNDANSLGLTADVSVTSAALNTSIDFGLEQRAVLGIALEARTLGVDADEEPGPYVAPGSPVFWEYIITNTGDMDLFGVILLDDHPFKIICPSTIIPVGESMRCESFNPSAITGQFNNNATVCGNDGSDDPANQVCADDSSHYFGVDAAIGIEVLTDGVDADNPPGPELSAGNDVSWSYIVTNTGNAPLSNVVVTDSNPNVLVVCPSTTLASGVDMLCSAFGVVELGQYSNTGTVVAVSPLGDDLTASDMSHYFGGAPDIMLEKFTNGIEALVAPGPAIPAGSTVVWTYEVTNNASSALTDITVTDDQGVVVTCPMDFLVPGQSMTCSGEGIAIDGQYVNRAIANGEIANKPSPPSNEAVSFYFGEAAMPMITIEKRTRNVDADLPEDAPRINVGNPVNWDYEVTNGGNIELINISVSDSEEGAVTCPLATLAPAESMVCSLTGTVEVGLYFNLGTVTASTASGETVSDDDPSHYFGLQGQMELEKTTNGIDADQAPGVVVAVGSTVTWEYLVTNTGNINLVNISIVDDQIGNINCPLFNLAPGESASCTATGTAIAGQYMNTGTACGQFDNDEKGTCASDPSHYFGGEAGLSIEKLTNGVDADVAPGPLVAPGDAINWTYTVSNTGTVELDNFEVSDDQGVVISCPDNVLPVGGSVICTGSGTAIEGQYANIGTACTEFAGQQLCANDSSHYFGVTSGLSIEKSTNGVDADTAPGVALTVGSPVTWVYLVTNTGNIELANVQVTDSEGVAVSCPFSMIAVGGTLECTGTGIATAGQYMNIGSVTGQAVDGDNPIGAPSTATDPSHYFGATTGLSIEKSTNGVDADAAPGVQLAVGSQVTWTYLVSNTGNVALADVQVTDSEGVVVSCPSTSIAVGGTLECTGTGVATAGQYMNIGAVTGQGVDDNGNPIGTPVDGSDPSHYFGAMTGLSIEKSTNGMDADAAPGPQLLVGSAVSWTYLVSNIGNTEMTDVQVTDSEGVAVSCPSTTVAVGATLECAGSGIATAGQYMNIGSVTGQGVDDNGNPIGAPSTASDPSHYFGETTGLSIEKSTNGADADNVPGPQLMVGSPVTWTYLISNTGSVALIDVQVTDSQGVAVNCPATTLAIGDTLECTGSGVATAGQYMNMGTASGQGVDSNGNPVGGLVDGSDPSHYFGLATAALGDLVFNDLDRDGVQDTNEPGVADVTVNLWLDTTGDGQPDMMIDSTQTDASGNYLFDNLDSTLSYIVQFVAPDFTGFTAQNQGGDTATDSNADPDNGITPAVSVPSGESDLSIDAGLIFLKAGIQVEKSTNGEDADTPTGPEVPVGSTVLWEYVVTNVGDYPLANVTVSDDQGVVVTCPMTQLALDEAMTCTGEGIALPGQYSNLGTASGQGNDNGTLIDPVVTDTDPSHYFGLDGCTPGFVFDQFSHVSYSNNDGDMDWDGPWKEEDPQGGGASDGSVMVDDGQLVLRDYPNSGSMPSARRTVDLSNHVAAMLSFDWSTSQEVGPEDEAVIEITTDGGASYTVLRTFGNLSGANSGSVMIDISNFLSAQTTIRFRVSKKFGGVWDKFMVDNVRIDKKCEVTTSCVATSAPNHAFWMSGFNSPSDIDRFDLEAGAVFEQFEDGTAQLTGTIQDNARPDRRFSVSMSFADRTSTPPPGSPKNDFGANTADWEYYPTWTGTWTGLDDYEGAQLSLARRGPAMQVGTGANDQAGEQNEYGASAWLHFAVEDQPNACANDSNLCIEHSGVGDLNIRLDCGAPIACTAAVEETHKHAFWFPDFNDDDVLDLYDMEPGAEFVRNADGTAALTGVIFKQDQPNYRFAVALDLSGGTDNPPLGSPYNPHGANPADWYYYPNWNGVLTGLTWQSGAEITLERRGSAFQIGTGANAHPDEQSIYGGSGWFDWEVQSQPNDCHDYDDCIKHAGKGDVNVRIEECPL